MEAEFCAAIVVLGAAIGTTVGEWKVVTGLPFAWALLYVLLVSGNDRPGTLAIMCAAGAGLSMAGAAAGVAARRVARGETRSP